MIVAWFSYFPVEWLPGVPDEVQRVPRQHPASWQRVLLAEFEKTRDLRLHIIVLRKYFERSFRFERNGVTFHLVKTLGGTRAPSLFWVDTVLIQRVLRVIKPDVVHVMVDGRIVKSGGPDLALHLEERGYEAIRKEFAPELVAAGA